MNKLKEYLMISIMALAILLITGVAKSEDKTTAIVGHVITQAIQGNDMDHTEILTNELNALIHKFSIDMIDIVMTNMPNILDHISAEIRQEADKKYKCSLQSEDYKNKECS
tara:strand:- start:455 stop:787 length:333 start_codon:yes stop_codon:yes gene_type:complete